MNNVSASVAFPLFFTFHGQIIGHRFLADIEVLGRVLAVHEHDGVWLSGVNPGGMAAGGKTLPEAHADFSRGFKSVLIGIANEAETFAVFKAEVERFVQESDDTTQAEWATAVDEVRAGRRDASQLRLLTKPASQPVVVKVHELSQEGLNPKQNVLNDEPEPALAA